MKHSDWLRLQIEGEKLCALLRQHNYRGQFISYRKLKLWLDAITVLIQKTKTLDELWQLGLWIRQECKKFNYAEPVVEYLRCVWAKHRDNLRRLSSEPRQIMV